MKQKDKRQTLGSLKAGDVFTFGGINFKVVARATECKEDEILVMCEIYGNQSTVYIVNHALVVPFDS